MSIILDEVNLHSGQYHLTEFAKNYFREAQFDQRSVVKYAQKYLHIPGP